MDTVIVMRRSLLFKPDTVQQAQVLPEVLTPVMVLDALEKAAG